jgi:hypothetical protein
MRPQEPDAPVCTRDCAFCHLLINLSGVYGEPHRLSIVWRTSRTTGRSMFVSRTE